MRSIEPGRTALSNPERAWHRITTATIERAEVERRLGPTSEPMEALTGGLANVTVRVGDRVLRIQRDAALVAKEAALLAHPWRSLRVPRLLTVGDDFLVTEYLRLEPLCGTREHGTAVGHALAEIHARTYPATGFLAPDLSLATPFPEGGFDPASYGRHMLREAAPYLDPVLVERVRTFLDLVDEEAAAAMDAPVLSHCDFKVSNLHVAPSGELVVLDWEFAWAGPRLLDVGSLLRWRPPEPFVLAFAAAYRARGGVLVDPWRRIAGVIDVGSLLGLFAHNAPARASPEVRARIAETIDSV
jgi:hypothetical protein